MNLSPKALERFWSYVQKADGDGCWVWIGQRDKDGYGVFGVGGKKLKAHRISYELHKGQLTSSILVQHKCDNRPCICPDHLEPGVPKSNAVDRAQKGRSARHAGATNGRAKLTEAQVREIRRLCKTTNTTYRDLGRQFGVSDVLIRKIEHRQLWQHI